MLERNHGHIVTIASMAGKTGVSGLVDYCASKHAAVGFHESMTAEIHTLKVSKVSQRQRQGGSELERRRDRGTERYNNSDRETEKSLDQQTIT